MPQQQIRQPPNANTPTTTRRRTAAETRQRRRPIRTPATASHPFPPAMDQPQPRRDQQRAHLLLLQPQLQLLHQQHLPSPLPLQLLPALLPIASSRPGLTLDPGRCPTSATSSTLLRTPKTKARQPRPSPRPPGTA